MNVSEALAWATCYLEKKQIEDSRLEAEILLAHALGTKRARLYAYPDKTLLTSQLINFQTYIYRRSLHEPTAYIIGFQPFMSLDFFVDRSVLIPRPETELLVEAVIGLATCLPTGRTRDPRPVTIADIGTGSGCIAISLAKHLPNVEVVGIDSSPAAIEIAQKNAKHHGVKSRCRFVVGNIFEKNVGTFDLIVSNPPYIPSSEIENLQPEVKDWEPREALDGGKDGLDHIRKIIAESPNHLNPGGFLLIEFGINQAGTIKQVAQKFFEKIEVRKDLSGRERFLLGRTKIRNNP